MSGRTIQLLRTTGSSRRQNDPSLTYRHLHLYLLCGAENSYGLDSCIGALQGLFEGKVSSQNAREGDRAYVRRVPFPGVRSTRAAAPCSC